MTEQEWRDEFANRMQRAFRKRGFVFQQEWADELGLSRNSINRYKNGERTIDAYTVYKMAKILDWPVEDLMVIDETPIFD